MSVNRCPCSEMFKGQSPITFIPGFFKPQQMIDVIGHVADNHNPTLSHLQIIHTMPIHFLGRSDPITKHREPKFNPGEEMLTSVSVDI